MVTNASVDRKRRIASIFQHYYPEGGWGLVLLLVVLLVQVILHGLLLSYGVLLPKVARRFRVSVVESGQDHLVSITHVKYLHTHTADKELYRLTLKQRKILRVPKI